MIKSVADILKAFMDEEAEKLGEYDLKHCPTIGDMYEGLSTDIVKKSIPEGLGLKIVDGFICGHDGKQSGQIDCMLVKGGGEKIPYTEHYKWHIKDVIAVFEVKKNLFGADLKDSFEHLREVSYQYIDYLDAGGTKGDVLKVRPAYVTFSRLTGKMAPPYSEHETLDPKDALIYHTLLNELLAPVRIVWGYNGYASEKSLRKGMIDFLSDQGSGQGFGVPSFPHLITCNGHSLFKSNGFPYDPQMINGVWEFYLSSQNNPVAIMLEFIWTRLELVCDVSLPWGDDLELESASLFLGAEPIKDEELEGWMYKYHDYQDPEEGDDEDRQPQEWQPILIDAAQHVILNRLCSDGKLDITSSDLVDFITKEGESMSDFMQRLLETKLVALNGNDLHLITEKLMLACTPKYGFVAADNRDGRFTRWLEKEMSA